jgi:hypothetical protein
MNVYYPRLFWPKPETARMFITRERLAAPCDGNYAPLNRSQVCGYWLPGLSVTELNLKKQIVKKSAADNTTL